MATPEKAQAAKETERHHIDLFKKVWCDGGSSLVNADLNAMLEAVREAERNTWQEQERVLREALGKIENHHAPTYFEAVDEIKIIARTALAQTQTKTKGDSEPENL